MALSPNALTTVAAVQEAPEVAGFTVAAVERAINVASDAIERHCDRTFGQAATVEKFPGTGRLRLVLARTPVRAVTQVKVDGAVLAAAEYRVEDADAGFLWRASGWPIQMNFATFLASVGVVPGSEEGTIEVSYDAGWVLPPAGGTRNLPFDVEEACIITARSLLLGRGRDRAVSQESVTGAAAVYAPGVIPPDACTLLRPYRRNA